MHVVVSGIPTVAEIPVVVLRASIASMIHIGVGEVKVHARMEV